MSLFRTLLFGLLVLFGFSLEAEVIYDHQICNYLTQKCDFDVQERYEEIFQDARFTKQDKSLSDQQILKLRALQNDIIAAVRNNFQTADFAERFDGSLEAIENLFCLRMPAEKDYEKKVPNAEFARQQLEESLAMIDQVLSRRIEQEGGFEISFQSEPTVADFLVGLFALVVDFYNPKNIQQRLQNFPEKDKNNFIKMRPLVCINVAVANQDEDDQEESQTGEDSGNYLVLTAYPNETLMHVNSQGQQKFINDLPYLFYKDPEQSSFWKKAVFWGGLACLGGAAVVGVNSAYNNWNAQSNECGTDAFAGPGCSRPSEFACRGELCAPEGTGADGLTSIVSENCYYDPDYLSVSFIGGKDTNGRPYSSHKVFFSPYGYNYVGQMKPGAWDCPAGKSPFHFLKDGRLCFNHTPIVRAGVDAPICKQGAPYCKLPDGLTLFAHGDDMLLKPPCAEAVKICKVGDLKFYRHDNGEFKEESICATSEGVCVFDENVIEFWNGLTQQWQDKPVNYDQEVTLYRFKNGNLNVFCKKDGSCSINFPCDLSAGVCPVGSTTFYSKKGSGVWTEGMPCVLGDEYCIIENGQVFYPHVGSYGDVEWSEVPAWTGVSTNGIYQGPDGKTFIPNKNCSEWELLNSETCLIKDGSLYCAEQDGQTRYWHNNQVGRCGWQSSPVCTGNEREGICIGPDGKVYILNSDLTRWIPERGYCKYETALFCVNENGSVSYWHRGAEQGQSGSWHDVPDCADFPEHGYCVGPDNRIFKFDEAIGKFVYLDQPQNTTASQLIRFGNNNYAVWDPAQSKWLLNDAPCSTDQHDVGYCPLDDGNELYSHADENGNKSWQLSPQVDDSASVIKLGDNTKRWRQVSDDSDSWTRVMPCPESDERYVVSREAYEAAKQNQTETGRAQIMLDPDTCVQVKPDNLQPYCPDSRVIPSSNQVAPSGSGQVEIGDQQVDISSTSDDNQSEDRAPEIQAGVETQDQSGDQIVSSRRGDGVDEQQFDISDDSDGNQREDESREVRAEIGTQEQSGQDQNDSVTQGAQDQSGVQHVDISDVSDGNQSEDESREVQAGVDTKEQDRQDQNDGVDQAVQYQSGQNQDSDQDQDAQE